MRTQRENLARAVSPADRSRRAGTLGVVLVAIAVSAVVPPAAADPPPNIILVLVDDQSWSATSIPMDPAIFDYEPIQARPETIAKYEALPPGTRHRNVPYAAMTEDLDTGIGLLRDRDRELGIEENTYFIFSCAGVTRPPVPQTEGAARIKTPAARGRLRRALWGRRCFVANHKKMRPEGRLVWLVDAVGLGVLPLPPSTDHG